MSYYFSCPGSSDIWQRIIQYVPGRYRRVLFQVSRWLARLNPKLKVLMNHLIIAPLDPYRIQFYHIVIYPQRVIKKIPWSIMDTWENVERICFIFKELMSLDIFWEFLEKNIHKRMPSHLRKMVGIKIYLHQKVKKVDMDIMIMEIREKGKAVEWYEYDKFPVTIRGNWRKEKVDLYHMPNFQEDD